MTGQRDELDQARRELLEALVAERWDRHQALREHGRAPAAAWTPYWTGGDTPDAVRARRRALTRACWGRPHEEDA